MKILNNLNFEQTINILGYKKVPFEYKAIYSGFISYLAKQKDCFLDDSDMDEIQKILDLSNELTLDLKNNLKVFNQNKDLVIASYYLKYALYIGIHPGANSLYEEPKCTLFDNLYFKAFMFICIVQESYLENIRRNIPKEHWEKRYSTTKNFVEKLVVKRQDMPFRFSTFSPFAQMYNIGHFMYMPYFHQAPCIAFRNDNKDVIFLALDNQVIRKDLQYDGVNKITNPLFTTHYEETDDSYIGNIINPIGQIEEKIVTLDKSKWHKCLSYGDMIIEFHVSDHYNLDDFYQSNVIALEFFKKYFPEVSFKALYGYSWLFSPQINNLVDENKSNIAKIKNTGYINPNRSGESLAFRFIFGKEHVEIDEIKETSSLLRNLKQYMLKGNHINCGSYYLLTDDITTYYNNKYIKYFDKLTL